MEKGRIMSESFMQWLHRVLVGTPEESLGGMSKKELELEGREHGIELDRRYKKATLVKQLKRRMAREQ
tara:strand:- start:1067 stop:1270 length:204 start_codon:yes stop_codon:yes gene_type:complete